MPQVLITLVCLVTLAQPSLSAAAYLIQLRNGRQVMTSYYWQQEHTIMFYTAGGVAGVAESAVLRIQAVEDPPEADLPQAAEQQAADTAQQQAADTAEAPRERPQTPPFDLEAARHKKEELKAQLDTTLERYRAASSAHDRDAKTKLQAELTAWSKQIFDLTEEVKQRHQGRLPEGWEPF